MSVNNKDIIQMYLGYNRYYSNKRTFCLIESISTGAVMPNPLECSVVVTLLMSMADSSKQTSLQ